MAMVKAEEHVKAAKQEISTLQLLDVRYGDPVIREFAVRQLDRLNDSQLGEVLLQLTQVVMKRRRLGMMEETGQQFHAILYSIASLLRHHCHPATTFTSLAHPSSSSSFSSFFSLLLVSYSYSGPQVRAGSRQPPRENAASPRHPQPPSPRSDVFLDAAKRNALALHQRPVRPFAQALPPALWPAQDHAEQAAVHQRKPHIHRAGWLLLLMLLLLMLLLLLFVYLLV